MPMRSSHLYQKLPTYFTRNKMPLRTVRLPYEILVLCAADETGNIESIIQLHLSSLSDVANHLVMKTTVNDTVARIVVHLNCSTAERAMLVQLVTRLGYEKSVRSVSWTGLAI